MPHYIRKIKQVAGELVPPTSRYLYSEVIHYTEDKIMTLKTYKKKDKDFYRQGTEWAAITPATEYRPDLVSYEIYGTPDLWWRIMEYNGMKDIMEFRSGINIKIPGNVLT